MASILEMAADILASQASTNLMTTDELISNLQKIHATLQALESGTELPQPEVEKPALTGKQSIKKNEVICLICNKGGFKTLTRHLNSAHGIKPGAYKKQFGIPAKQSLSATSLTAARKKTAIEKGLGDNLAKARAAKTLNATETITITATIVKIDSKTKSVDLKDNNGKVYQTVVAPNSGINLRKYKVGDSVQATIIIAKAASGSVSRAKISKAQLLRLQ